MNRALKEATVYHYYYDIHQQLREHLTTFLLAYNFAKCLKEVLEFSNLREGYPEDENEGLLRVAEEFESCPIMPRIKTSSPELHVLILAEE